MPVIEDYEVDSGQTSLKKEKKQKTKKRKNADRIVFWAVFLGVCFAVSFGPVSRSLAATGAVDILGNLDSYRRKANSKQVTVWFAHPTDGDFEYRSFEASAVKTGESDCHDVVECLISGASLDAVAAGFSSLVPSDTKLIGLTVSCGWAFVDFSQEILGTAAIWGEKGLAAAARQVLLSLHETDSSINNIALLADGLQILCL